MKKELYFLFSNLYDLSIICDDTMQKIVNEKLFTFNLKIVVLTYY